MKIWIDARICDENGYYSLFVQELIESFIAQNTQHEIIVYRKHNLPIDRHSLFTDLQERKIFEKEKFALMVFFDHHVPYGYKGDYIVLIESLKEVFFPKKKWIQRYIFQWKLKRAIEKALKVFVLDGGSAMELNEQLNISEEKIEQIPGFFPKYITPGTQLSIDIKAKHNLRGEYLIYDSGNEVHNNFDRILKTLKNLKEKGIILNIIILCDETTKDIDIRNTSLEYQISDQILFLGSGSPELEEAYYTQSLGVIFSSIYESFPFQFVKALHYKTRIFANNIPANKNVMGEHILYLDPLSIHHMADTIAASIGKKSHPHYEHISESYAAMISASCFQERLETKK